MRWRYVHDEPWFDNQVATLELDGRHVRMRLEKTQRREGERGGDALHLESVFERDLS